MRKKTRDRLLVEPKVQLALVGRVTLYWLMCFVMMTMVLLTWKIVTGPTRGSFFEYFRYHDLWTEFGPAVVAALLLLPVILVDVLRVSNRIAGPVYRLRRCIEEAANGDYVTRVQFRDDDYWQDMAENFNALLTRVKQLQSHHDADQIEATFR